MSIAGKRVMSFKKKKKKIRKRHWLMLIKLTDPFFLTRYNFNKKTTLIFKV